MTETTISARDMFNFLEDAGRKLDEASRDLAEREVFEPDDALDFLEGASSRRGPETDFILKDEGGYVAVKPQTEAAKRWAHHQGWPNELHAQFPQGFCGQPTWAPGAHGLYSFGIRHAAEARYARRIEAAGFSQEGA